MLQLDVEVQNVELVRTLAHAIQHQECVRYVIVDRLVESHGRPAARHQLGARAGVGRSEQRDFVSLAHQLLGQKGNHPLRSSVPFGRDGLGERSNLSDAHKAL
jgi:hypothetical protein